MPSVLDILRPQVVQGIANEIMTPYDKWQDYFSLGPKGASCQPSEVRSISYDIVNDDRKVSSFSAPGADATRIPPQVIGNRQVTCPRTFEAMELSYETVNNIRSIGKAADPGSQAGLAYVREQLDMQERRMRRNREFLIWGALRGSCQVLISGNKWIPVMTGGTFTFDWGVSANHKNQLNGLITASWDTVGTAIISNLGTISAQAESDHGAPIKHIWCNTKRWITTLACTQVINMGGSANTAFDQWLIQTAMLAKYGGDNVDSSKIEATAVLKGFPSIIWHITDRIIDVNGTLTKYFADDEVFFQPDPDKSWIRGYEVKESTNQTYGQQPVDVYGKATWMKYPVDSDVPKCLLYGLDNFFPAVNPNAIWFGDVVP